MTENHIQKADSKIEKERVGDLKALLGKNIIVDQILKKEDVNKKVDTVVVKNIKKRNKTLDVAREDEYSCDTCDFRCYVLSEMKKHKYSHGVQQFSCDQCNYNSPSSKEVRRHKKRQHSEKTISCDQCEFATYHLNLLKAHKMSKYENIAFSCNQCDQSFSNKGGLRRHGLRVHLGLVFTCNECQQQFSTRDWLQNHVRAAHEGATFACEVPDCDYVTAMKANLQKHMKKTHF